MLICVLSCILAIAGCFLLLLTQRVLRTFGPVTFAQILIHINMPRELVPDDFFKRLLNTGWKSYLVLGLLLLYCLFNFLLCNNAFSLYCSHILQVCLETLALYKLSIFLHTRLQVVLFFISFLLFILSLLYCMFKLDILGSLLARSSTSQLIDEFYADNNLKDFKLVNENGKPLETIDKPNLILIVSESLESTFSNSSLFKENLLRELTDYQRTENHINDLHMVRGCECTITALYAIQYGLPILYFSSYNGDPLAKNPFRKSCFSVFDVLNANGYSTTHIQGSMLRFASTDVLFKSITNAKIRGLEDFPQELYSSRHKWGLWDSDLFEAAKAEITELRKNGLPFALSLSTMDTHFDNVLQPGNESKYNGDMRDIIRLQSRLIDKFIKWVQQSEFGNNTVIVILGDHNMMTEKIGNINLASEDSRRIFNVILNSKAKSKIPIDRHAAMFDIAPTILEAMGFDWPSQSLGIGRSLYGKQPTILEKYGLKVWDKEAQKSSPKYMRIISP